MSAHRLAGAGARWRALAAVLAAAAGGCATLDPGAGAQRHLASASAPVRECAGWYRALDEAVEANGVRDAQYPHVAGFPYLRVDRLLASLHERAARSEAALRAYAERLLELDLEARRYEIDNLPRGALDSLPAAKDLPRGVLLQRTRECGRLLRDADLSAPAARAEMLAGAQVPDDYSDASRLFGLYPLTRLVFSSGVRRWEAEALAGFRDGLQAPPGASMVRYAPPTSPAAPIARQGVAALLGRAELDALGQPELAERELARLAAAYAPSFEIPVAGDYDRFGRLVWRQGASSPEVDAAQSTVYVGHAFTRYRERNGEAGGADLLLLQLVYTIWFPERPAQSEGDLYAGRLDGLVWRVTLAPDGEPLVYDSIHPCGCYHQFFPTPRAQPRPAPDAREEWAFVPQSLPRVAEGERPLVRLASRTHYIERVSLVRGADSVARYAFRDYDELRSLARPEGGRASVFGPDGLVPGTERAERWLFWPMGIASAGAMRQWGRQATAFVGRRHFDDADLLERRFEMDLSSDGP